MRDEPRSLCPINLSLEILGDRWSLLILRDMIFGGGRHFRELLQGSQEGIASNILADRLKRLMAAGILTRADDPTHKQKAIYSLTEMGIQLVPVFAVIGSWGRRHLPVSPDMNIRAQVLEEGGPAMWEAFMAELREAHLGIPRPEGTPSVVAALRAAYEAVLAESQTAEA